MPNDARAGLFVGIVVVIGLAIVYRGGSSVTSPDAQIPGRQGAVVSATDAPGLGPSPIPGKEASGDDFIRKKDAANRINGEPDAADQQDQE